MMRWMFFGKTAAVMAQILMLILSLDGTPGSRCSPTIFKKENGETPIFSHDDKFPTKIMVLFFGNQAIQEWWPRTSRVHNQ